MDEERGITLSVRQQNKFSLSINTLYISRSFKTFLFSKIVETYKN